MLLHSCCTAWLTLCVSKAYKQFSYPTVPGPWGVKNKFVMRSVPDPLSRVEGLVPRLQHQADVLCGCGLGTVEPTTTSVLLKTDPIPTLKKNEGIWGQYVLGTLGR